MEIWRTLSVGDRSYRFASLDAADAALGGAVGRLPVCLKILLENVLRNAPADGDPPAGARALCAPPGKARETEVGFFPARVLMPDSSGLPLIADLAALRDGAVALGIPPARVEPQIPVDLVVDHSLIVDVSGRPDAETVNLDLEIARNAERYRLVRWAQTAFSGLKVVPPGNGICHQINLERLARVVQTVRRGEDEVAFFDTLVGMDSHTPMVNSLGVLGWGVGGIEAATAMLGEPIGLTVPRVVGCRLMGELPRGASTTDLALLVTQRLRRHGVVGAFVEFFGPGARALSLPQRASLSNMAPEYGATAGLFAVDAETLRFLRVTGRPEEHVALVGQYARAQGAFVDEAAPEPDFAEQVQIDLAEVEPSAAGPRRPQDRLRLSEVPQSFRGFLAERRAGNGAARPEGRRGEESGRPLADGDVVIAALTSCTNTSNPSVMMEAGLLARNAVARGLTVKPWVKASLAPGSRVVADYLAHAGLDRALDALGFNLVGFGCTTCMGHSGPLLPEVVAALATDRRVVCAVLCGNRNFEGRIHNAVAASYLVSPALVVAYAIAGTVLTDLAGAPLGTDPDGRPVFLSDILPDREEVDEAIRRFVGPDAFRRGAAPFVPQAWEALRAPSGDVFGWEPASSFIRRPPFLDGIALVPQPRGGVSGARALLLLGDSVTTDHISPVSRIAEDSAAGRYLDAVGVPSGELGSFMARRVNHDVMLRGTFANPYLVNELVPGAAGGMTRHQPSGETMEISAVAARYGNDGVPLVVVAGADYGAGSSRDWAAKGTRLLGIRAILAESFERIHRSNLLGMGIVPLEFPAGCTRRTLGLDGTERYDIPDLATVRPGGTVTVHIRRADGTVTAVDMRCRIDTPRELEWVDHGGILPLALRNMAAAG